MDSEQPAMTLTTQNREDFLIEAARRDAQVSETTVIIGTPQSPFGRFPEIPNYTILSEIDRGGQGVVFKAVQQSTKRPVAVKVLLAGTLASEKERRRFEREIDLIASLRHPNIVTVYDGGTTKEGHSYYAMEYIEGVQLDEYVRLQPSLQPTAGRQSVKNLLDLFDKVCVAVSYAHQHGVIHRDLKPGNIRVDANGEPHILDFGLAKIVAAEDEQSRLTVTGAFVGTLAYAAPEQAGGSPSLVGTGTDVYSLGVILYEMLTGHFPYPVVGTMVEVLRNIAEAKPQRPSSWGRRSQVTREPSTSGMASRRVDGELETIILKALAKEPERRYPSAEQLRRDIENYLSGRPVEAKPDSALYVLRKLAVRHLYATTVLVFLMVAIVAFALISFDFYRQAQKALNDKQRSDAVALQRTQDVGLLDTAARQALHRMSFEQFLTEWDEGRLDRARQTAGRLPKDSAERAATSFLLDEGMSREMLLAKLKPDSRGLVHFVVGERHRKQKQIAEAIAAYEASLAADGTMWFSGIAEQRLNQLRSVTSEDTEQSVGEH